MKELSEQQVLSQLREIVSDVGDTELAEADFRMDMSVLEDIGLNSVDFLELAFEIEKKWNIVISDDEFRSVKNVGDVVRTIINKVQTGEQES